MTAASRTSGHRHSGVHPSDLSPDEEACVYECVSPLKFPVQMAAHSHLLEALSDRDNLSLKLFNFSLLSDPLRCPWGLGGRNFHDSWNSNGTRISWSGLTLLSCNMDWFSRHIRSKSLSKQEQTPKVDQTCTKPSLHPFFLCLLTPANRMVAKFFYKQWFYNLMKLFSAKVRPWTHPADHRADSFSVWQEAVVAVALPALLSFRKLGFSIATVTAALLLPGSFNDVKARLSEALAESASLSIKIKRQVYDAFWKDGQGWIFVKIRKKLA